MSTTGILLKNQDSTVPLHCCSLYIADTVNNRVRMVSPEGIIITVAGNGSRGFSGDGGHATNAELHFPTSVAVGADGRWVHCAISDALNPVTSSVLSMCLPLLCTACTLQTLGTAVFAWSPPLESSARWQATASMAILVMMARQLLPRCAAPLV